MENQKFYQKVWFMWLTLVIFAPVGIFLLWKDQRYSKNVRVALSVVSGLIFIIAVVSGNKSNTTPALTSTPSVTQEQPKAKTAEQTIEQPKEAMFDFSNVELTKENITKAIESTVGKDKLKEVDITTERGMNIVDVTFNPGSVWDEKSLVKESARTATSVMEILFKNPKVDKVWVWTETEMTDSKGNNKAENVINVSLTKENAKDINWPSFKNMVSADYNKLFNIADSKFIHPGIANKLN